jgi:hypothetical protein
MNRRLNNGRKFFEILFRDKSPVPFTWKKHDSLRICVPVPGAFSIRLYRFGKGVEHLDNLQARFCAARPRIYQAAYRGADQIPESCYFRASKGRCGSGARVQRADRKAANCVTHAVERKTR